MGPRDSEPLMSGFSEVRSVLTQKGAVCTYDLSQASQATPLRTESPLSLKLNIKAVYSLTVHVETT